MGSWEGTCGVSQLPILYDEEVALFILVKNNLTQRMSKTEEIGGGGLVHPDSLYKPICLPIFGNYADYGMIDNIEDKGDVVLSHLKYMRIYSSNEEYGIDNLSDFLRKIERNKIDNFGFMMVHKDLYYEMIDYIRPMSYFYTKEKDIGEFYKNETESLLKIMKENNLGEDFIRKNLTLEDYRNPDLKIYEFTHDKRIAHNMFTKKTDDYMQYYRNPELYENNKDLLENMVNFLLFTEIMECSRKLWIPQAGKGSQDREYEYAKIIGKFAEKKMKEMDEW